MMRPRTSAAESRSPARVRRRTSRFEFEILEPRLLLTALPTVARQDINLDSTWQFNQGDVAGAQAAKFNDSSWSTTTLPHTWNAQDGADGGNNYYRGIGWYRRHFNVPAADAGQEMFLKFDAAST